MMHRTTNGRYQLCHLTLAVALGLGLSSGVAIAQSNATGVIFGQAKAEPSATVHIENIDTGLTRDLSLDSSGRYRASSLPVGRYRVTLRHDGQAVSARDNVSVQLGRGVEVSFTGASTASAQNLEAIQVVASAIPAIDVSSVDNRTVLTSEQLAKVPLQRNITAAALLAPGTVSGDSRFGNLASFNGSSIAENTYYINGYNVTNPLTNFDFTSLPFDAIDQTQILSGGYGAEFGRSTGGVINITTKRGGNTWKGGAAVYWEPEALMAGPRSIYRPQVGAPDSGTLFNYNSRDTSWQTSYGAYISGPLIRDKLFIYATGEFIKQQGSRVNSITSTNGATDFDVKTPRWLGKLDWNITDNHIIELTALSDKTTEQDDFADFDYSTLTRGLGTGGGEYFKNGDKVYVGKYTGYLTDTLTLTALYGRSELEHVDVPDGVDPTCPRVIDQRGVSNPVTGCQVAGQVLVPGANDKTNGWRIDLEWQLGDHDLRGGVDTQTFDSFTGTAEAGGELWIYTTVNPDVPLGNGNNTVPGTSDVVFRQVFATGARVKTKEEAQYVEDRWQINDRWLASIGLRNEQFNNFNGDGVSYARQRHQLAPRLGVSWDVNGDSTFKIFANAGRYHLAMPNNVAVRAASGSLFETEFFSYTGMDPRTSAPLGTVQIGPTVFQNGENGSSPDPHSVAATDLKSNYQDEYILGFQKSLGSAWTFGARATYRKLRSTIDDFCDSRPFHRWAQRNGVGDALIDPAASPGAFGCFLFNPGGSNSFTVDITGDGVPENIQLTKDDLNYPPLKRAYYGLDLFLEHPFDGRWFGRIDYTFARSYGNTEGQVKSDIGQTDVSVTQDWDAPELMQFANGPLPNDRTHQLKAYGYFQMNPEWLFGASLLVSSGRPKNCIGFFLPGADGNETDPLGYGSSYFACDGKPSPRGSKGRLPWTYRLDLNAAYSPAFAHGNLTFKVDVFNLINQQRTLSIQEIHSNTPGNASSGFPVKPDYTQVLSYSDPRTVRLSVKYDFSL
jgi:hypothetical protein